MDLLQIIAGIVITLFFVIGVTSVIKWLVLKIVAPSDSSKRFYGVVLKGKNADIELQMAMETLNWYSGFDFVRVYAVDCGIDEVCYAACRDLCKNSRFRLISVKDFSKILSDNNL